jgi:hypothetical protein
VRVQVGNDKTDTGSDSDDDTLSEWITKGNDESDRYDESDHETSGDSRRVREIRLKIHTLLL